MQAAASTESPAPAPTSQARDRSFFKHVLTLLTGTAIAQVLPIAVTPVLTRVFSPEDFGQFGIFFSVATLFSVAATLRYSFALLLPEKDEQALQIAGLCLAIALGLSLALGVALIPFTSFWVNLFKQPAAAHWLWLAPVSTLFAGTQITLYALANRKRNFRVMSVSKVAQAGGTALGAIVLGLMGVKTLGLIWGYIFGQALAIAWLCTRIGEYRQYFASVTTKAMAAVSRRYRNFALIALPADFINSLTNQLPIFFITHYFSESIVGQYNLTFRVTLGPLSILGVAILDVFKERAARDYAEHGTCRPIFLKTAKTLAIVGVPLLLALYPLAPLLFEKIFGAEWRLAGEYTQILIPLFIVRFIVSPLSYIMYIAEKNAYDLLWQIGLLLGVSGIFYWGGSQGNFLLTLKMFTWLYVAMYLVYFFMNLRFTRRAK